jgi:hypothetical protein
LHVLEVVLHYSSVWWFFMVLVLVEQFMERGQLVGIGGVSWGVVSMVLLVEHLMMH